jgi:hypothetical protein
MKQSLRNSWRYGTELLGDDKGAEGDAEGLEKTKNPRWTFRRVHRGFRIVVEETDGLKETVTDQNEDRSIVDAGGVIALGLDGVL